jgi:hypothetical protein
MVQTAVAQVNCPLHFMISYFGDLHAYRSHTNYCFLATAAVRTKDDNIWAISLCTGDMQNVIEDTIRGLMLQLLR